MRNCEDGDEIVCRNWCYSYRTTRRIANVVTTTNSSVSANPNDSAGQHTSTFLAVEAQIAAADEKHSVIAAAVLQWM